MHAPLLHWHPAGMRSANPPQARTVLCQQAPTGPALVQSPCSVTVRYVRHGVWQPRGHFFGERWPGQEGALSITSSWIHGQSWSSGAGEGQAMPAKLHLAERRKFRPEVGPAAACAHAGGAMPVLLRCWHRRQTHTLQVKDGGACFAAEQVSLHVQSRLVWRQYMMLCTDVMLVTFVSPLCNSTALFALRSTGL